MQRNEAIPECVCARPNWFDSSPRLLRFNVFILGAFKIEITANHSQRRKFAVLRGNIVPPNECHFRILIWNCLKFESIMSFISTERFVNEVKNDWKIPRNLKSSKNLNSRLQIIHEFRGDKKCAARLFSPVHFGLTPSLKQQRFAQNLRW